ncbi:Hsp70 family protein [Paractinoplanes atraurantiacus]|uniref:Molecular chaperone DnaK (HSP70) n=1 Tax=Paractinoplanes atraurantiacus TaxID=1036182 RepID=A0A285JY56_9ACTN|nr:Hsp70 family protein [Actinoplanes atraurantiacus]SNY65245.1 Molecular chaperone DnaK (HSP70) [Actinoplanes atraurantiacus]
MTGSYGIDFGTTNCVLARTTPDGPETVPLEKRLPAEWAHHGFNRVLPSVMGYQDGEPAFGWPMKLRAEGRIEAVKRLLASDDPIEVDGRKLDPELVAELFFRQIRDRAGEPLDQAVVTIPSNSRGRARLRTKQAAAQAGIKVLALINEPTAAAMAHARRIGTDRRILVFDWGGGTLDVTVLEAVEGTFIEQASKGVQRLGGMDLDGAFLARLRRELPGAADWTPAEREQFRTRLELAKIQLSETTEAEVKLPDGRYAAVRRALLESAIRPLIERTRRPLETCLSESPGPIDHLVMVGGSSRIPAVRQFVAGLVGVEPDDTVDPMSAVAEGAAVAAGILRGEITDLDFFVGTEHALGLVAMARDSRELFFGEIIGRNTKYPASNTQPAWPTNDFQESVLLDVVEGDPARPLDDEDNVVLASWEIALPERRRRDDARLDITYTYDLDGILRVRVEDHKTGSVLMDGQLEYGSAR